MAPPKIRVLAPARFSTDAFDKPVRFQAWREFLPLYTVLPHAELPESAFSGHVVSWALGPIGIGITAYSPQRYTRTRQRISADGQDHFIIQLLTGGGLHATTADGRDILVRAGDIWVHDLGRPKTVTTDNCRTISILLSRQELQAMVGAVELDGYVLQRGAPLTTLLAQHLRTLSRIDHGITGEESMAAALGTLALTGACLRPGVQIPDAARGPVATILKHRIREYMDANLSSPDLTAERLCAVFRLSRASLYRMFAPEGGIAAYIRHRRLERAEAMLRNPANARRTIADIAYDCGFVSEAHFSRAFRTSFGLPPREVRGTGLGPIDENILERWEAVIRR